MKKKVDATKIEISFSLNGEKKTMLIKSSMILLDLIRDEIGLTGTKTGCNEGECGACTVLINDVAVNSCLFPAINIQGKNVTTIEGISDGVKLDPVQEALIEKGGVQCGFCTSGMVMTIKGMQTKFKKGKHKPTTEEIKKGLEGNLCRCTGYVKIVEAAEKVIHGHS